MAAPQPGRTIVVDANIIINLIHAGLLRLFCDLPECKFVVPEDVVAEILNEGQREQLQRTIADGCLSIETITEPDDLTSYAELRRTLGKGEAACIVIAKRHTWSIASDEKGRFRTSATSMLGPGRLVNTPGLLVMAIRATILSVAQADAAKDLLERNRFRMPFGSFSELV